MTRNRTTGHRTRSTSSRRSRLSTGVAACLLALALHPAPAAAQDVYDIDCGRIGERVCIENLDQEWEWGGLIQGCDRGLAGPVCLDVLRFMDGEVSAIQSQPAFWQLQQQLLIGRDEPLNFITYIHAHNAFNNQADLYAIPNQFYSMSDQLRLGARMLELDVHSLFEVTTLSFDVHLCHSEKLLFLPSELCTDVERHVVYGLIEIAQWAVANPGEIVILRFDEFLEGHSDAQEELLQSLDAAFGDLLLGFDDLVFDPFGRPAYWPTARQMTESGRRVLVLLDTRSFSASTVQAWDSCPSTAACEFPALGEFFPGGNNKVGGGRTFSQGDFSDDADFDGFGFDPAVDCSSTGDNHVLTWSPGELNTLSFSGFREDRLDIPAIYDGAEEVGLICSRSETDGNCTPVSELASCNVRAIQLDEVARHDRYPDMIWSWSDGEVGADDGAAMLDVSDGRWTSREPEERHHFACGRPRIRDPITWEDRAEGLGPLTQWRITDQVGPWEDGPAACLEEFGEYGLAFGVPVNALQNQDLLDTFHHPVRDDLDGDCDVDEGDVAVVVDRLGEAASGPYDPVDVDGDGTITHRDARMLAPFARRVPCFSWSDDLDLDGDVDEDDAAFLLSRVGTSSSGSDDPGDFDGDGLITLDDVRLLIGRESSHVWLAYRDTVPGPGANQWDRIAFAVPEPGDLDLDCDVDADDLSALLARLGPASGPDDPADVDGDGVIGYLDARLLIAGYANLPAHAFCSSAPTPWPPAAAGAACGSVAELAIVPPLALLWRRRRGRVRRWVARNGTDGEST